uniref:Uncharacterized protein n=1 Tax=Siphoviridae sp. ctZHD14 TaxID=2827891 RepID=A0A8S5SWG5_9CAUD|nr:MAG TPA: hypothetical protein [Siphoviridae sp. ctZHD14]
MVSQKRVLRTKSFARIQLGKLRGSLVILFIYQAFLMRLMVTLKIW